jgi:hypothetical protein
MSRFTGTNNLGETQAAMLKAVVEHHGWQEGCGWLWSTPSGTVRLLEPLVRRGVVTKTGEGRTAFYRPTEQAVAWYVETYPVLAQRRGLKPQPQQEGA